MHARPVLKQRLLALQAPQELAIPFGVDSIISRGYSKDLKRSASSGYLLGEVIPPRRVETSDLGSAHAELFELRNTFDFCAFQAALSPWPCTSPMLAAMAHEVLLTFPLVWLHSNLLRTHS